ARNCAICARWCSHAANRTGACCRRALLCCRTPTAAPPCPTWPYPAPGSPVAATGWCRRRRWRGPRAGARAITTTRRRPATHRSSPTPMRWRRPLRPCCAPLLDETDAMTAFQLDSSRIAHQFGRAADTYEKHDVLQRAVHSLLLDRLDFYLE